MPVPVRKRYLLPSANLKVEYQASGTVIILRGADSGGQQRVRVREATVKEFVAAYKREFPRTSYANLYGEFSEYTADEWLEFKKYEFEEEDEYNSFVAIYDELKSNANVLHLHHGKSDRKVGRPPAPQQENESKTDSSTSPESSDQSNTHSQSETASNTPSSHSKTQSETASTTETAPSSTATTTTCTPRRTASHHNTYDSIIRTRTAYENKQLSLVLDALHGVNEKVMGVLNRMSTMDKHILSIQTEIKDVHQIVQMEKKKKKDRERKKKKYDKEEKKEEIVPRQAFDQCGIRQQQRRAKAVCQAENVLIGGSKAGHQKVVSLKMKEPTFAQALCEHEKLVTMMSEQQQRIEVMKRESIGNLYNEMLIMVANQLSSNQNDSIRFDREFVREYKFDVETGSYSLGRAKKKKDGSVIHVAAKELKNVQRYVYRREAGIRIALLPKVWAVRVSDNEVAYIKYVSLQHLVRFLCHRMMTHISFAGNTSLYHRCEIQAFIARVILKKNDEENGRWECRQWQLNEEQYIIDDEKKSVVLLGCVILFAFKYDAKGKIKWLPKKSLTHGGLAAVNVLRPGLIQSPHNQALAAIGNVGDTSKEWLSFLVQYLSEFDLQRLDTLVDKAGGYEIYSRNELLLVLCADMSAQNSANGAKKNSQQWLCILTPGKGNEEDDSIHSFDGDLIELEGSKTNRVDFERLQLIMMYDEYQRLKNENSPYLPRKRFITEIPGAYRKKIDIIRDELAATYRRRGIPDDEIDDMINGYFADEGLFYNKKAVPLMYNEVLFDSLHAKIGSIKHLIVITISECLGIYKLAKPDIVAVLDAFAKYDRSLEPQIATIKNKVNEPKSGTLKLSMTGDVANRFELILPCYHKLFVAKITKYRGDPVWIATHSIGSCMSYHVQCFFRCCGLHKIDVNSRAFNVIFDALVSFGRNLSNTVYRVFPSKLKQKYYLIYVLRVFPFKLKALFKRYKVGACAWSTQGAEHKGKIAADQFEFVQRYLIKDLPPSNDDEIDDNRADNYIDQIFRRIIILEFGLFDFGRIAFDTKKPLQRQNYLDHLVQMQQAQIDEDPEKKQWSLWQLKFFEDLTQRYFDDAASSNDSKQIHPDIAKFNDYATQFRDLTVSDILPPDITKLTKEYEKKAKEINVGEKRDIDALDDMEWSLIELADKQQPPKKKQKRGKKIKDNAGNKNQK